MEYAYFYMYTAVVKCATNGINRYGNGMGVCAVKDSFKWYVYIVVWKRSNCVTVQPGNLKVGAELRW